MAVSHLYTKQIAREVRNIKRPVDFAMDIVAYPEFLSLRVKEEQIMAMNDIKQLQVMEYLQKVRVLLESHGIRCELEGVRYSGK